MKLALGLVVMVLFARCLAGCAAPVGGPFYVSSKFQESEEAQITEAAEAWEVATYGAIHFDLVFGADVEPSVGSAWGRRIITPITAQEWLTTDLTIGHEVNAGYCGKGTNYQAIVVLVDSGVPVRDVVDHELGHSLGLKHVAEPTALMFGPDAAAPGVERVGDADRFVTGQCLSAIDARQLKALHPDVERVRLCP